METGIGRFGLYLERRGLPADEVGHHLKLAAEMEGFFETLPTRGVSPEPADARAFIAKLVLEGRDTLENIMAVARYGRATGSDAVYLAGLELLDGGEVMGNLYSKVLLQLGRDILDRVFEGITLPGLGTPNTEKPALMACVMRRLEECVGRTSVERLLSSCLRDLPDESFAGEKDALAAAGSVEELLRRKRDEYLSMLESHCGEGTLYFNQRITPEVLEYVRLHPETEVGVLEGGRIIVTKIPYSAAEYLAESDPARRRYLCCHCPWVRESIAAGDVEVPPSFCLCSGGFAKKPWEAALGTHLEVEVLESALRGDDRCRFAIRLPT
jgi:hypothetical protein